MPAFLTESKRIAHAGDVTQRIRGATSHLLGVKALFDQLRGDRTAIESSLTAADGVYSADDLAEFDGAVRPMVLGLLNEGLLTSDLAGGTVATTVGGTPVQNLVGA